MSSSDGPSRAPEAEPGFYEERVEAVLRVLAGGDRFATARDHGVDLDDLEEWIRVFLQAGREGLREARNPMDGTERLRAWAKIGELAMRVDLLRRFIARKGYADELEALERNSPSPKTGS